jgi:putative sterol carrier protein
LKKILQAYTMAKYGMSFCVLGMSEEFKDEGVAVNALWPRTAIATDAIDFIGSVEMRKQSRTVDIMSDAAYQILIKDSRSFTGKFVIDEHLLRDELGITNFDKYAVDPSSELMLDFFVDEDANVKSPTLVGFVKGASSAAPAAAATAAATNAGDKADISGLINAMRVLLSPELVEKMKGVYSFQVEDASTPSFYLDLTSGSGQLQTGDFAGKPDVTFKTKSNVMQDMADGKIKPSAAFMAGKLKITGNINMAMKFEKLMSQLKVSQPAAAPAAAAAAPATGGNSELDSSMAKIRALISPELVEKTKGVYKFVITDASSSDWHLDLKNGSGSLSSGAYEGTANCTMTMNSEVFNNMVKGSLKPTAAFMAGKLKIKGDMGLAMKLEKIMNSVKSKL